MRRTELFLLLVLTPVFAAYGGLSVGLPGAVKKQVSKLDDKILAAEKKQNTPAALSAQAGNGAVEISWAAVPGASSYNLYLGNTPQLSSLRPLSRTSGVTSPYYLSGLTNGVTYYYGISSVADGVESNLSPAAQIAPSALLPLRPENVAGAGGYGQTTLNWNPVAGAASYKVYWSGSPGVTKASAVLPGVTVSSCAHSGLAYGRTYYYRVSAVNSAGESLPSAEAQCSTLALPLSYLIDSPVFTTLDRTVLPVAVSTSAPKTFYPYEITKYSENGYGLWNYGAGFGLIKRPDLMPVGYSTAAVTNAAGLARFFAMTDIHIADKESPGEGVYLGYKGGTSSAYSAVMLHTTHVLDAAVQTINALHKKKKFDFGISLGDVQNSEQYNELRWYIDVLDGRVVSPDSGVKDDPVPGPNNDYQDEFKAVGLDSTIPWYQTLGNHDHFWMGSFVTNNKARQAAIGSDMMDIGNFFTNTLGLDSTGYYAGAVDGSTEYGNIIGTGTVALMPIPPTTPADADRRIVTVKEWMAEFLNTTSSPAGHGFSAAGAAAGFASYTFEPRAEIPLKVIVLDDTQTDADPFGSAPGPAYGHGSLDAARYTWLKNELQKGQDEGKLMVIAAHVPLGRPAGALDGWSADPLVTAVLEPDLIAKLQEYPNLVMWIAGHCHRNTVAAFVSTDAAHPENGFWGVETASLRDFPQQFRTFDIVRNSDNSVSVLALDVDTAARPGSFAYRSRSYGIAAAQWFANPTYGLEPSYVYNAELFKPLSAEMQVKIQAYGTPIP